MVEVIMTLKNPKANCAIQGAAMETSAHCQGSLNTHRSVIVWRRGAPVNTIQVLCSIRPNMTMKKVRKP